MRDPARILPILAGFLLLAPAGLGGTVEGRPAEPPTYEVWYTLDAEVRTVGGRADIRAGGRLLMRPASGPAGGARHRAGHSRPTAHGLHAALGGRRALG